MTVYISYPTACQPTGDRLVERLGATRWHEDSPLESGDVFIGWGAKDNPTPIEGVTYLNHPRYIARNRNKLLSLEWMQDCEVRVPRIYKPEEFDAELISPPALPVIGRRLWHQGGSGFWYCNSYADVKKAHDAGAQFFLQAVRVEEEYRIHVIEGVVVRACKKVMHRYPQDAWVKNMMDKLYPNREEDGAGWEEAINDEATDERVAYKALKKAARYGKLPDMTLRSNERGWKFVETDAPSGVEVQAITAVDALGLTFGAVDIVVNEANGKAVVLEVNTAPGLTGTTLDQWVEKLQMEINTATTLAPGEIADRIRDMTLSTEQLQAIEAVLCG